MNKAEEKICQSFFSAEQAIDAAKWDKNSPWKVLVDTLDGIKPLEPCKSKEKNSQKKSEK